MKPRVKLGQNYIVDASAPLVKPTSKKFNNLVEFIALQFPCRYYSFMFANLLTLNTSKTEFLLIGLKQ